MEESNLPKHNKFIGGGGGGGEEGNTPKRLQKLKDMNKADSGALPPSTSFFGPFIFQFKTI